MLEPKRNCHFLATLCAGILAAVASQLAGADVIAQWHFDEAPGETLAHDSVGAHDGALSGSAAFVEGGVSGNPISVTRSGDGFVNMGDIFPFTSGDFSIVVWARVSPGDLTPDSMFAAKHRSTIVSGHFLCMNHPWGTPGKATFYQGSAWVNSLTDVNDGAWHQIVGVHHATGLHEIYVDGAPVENAVPSTPMYGIDAPFLVGGLDFGGVPQGVLDGLVDEVQVYDCALTDAQVQYLLEHPAEAVATIVYFNDFESGAGPEWSNTTTDITPVGARRFLGQFGNGTVSLTLTDLPPHGEAIVACDLFVIRSWDGNNTTYGPDIWDCSVAGGPNLLHTTFANTEAQQAYPDSYPGGDHPAGTGAAEIDTLGYPNFGDSVYNLSFGFAHSGPTLTLNFSATGLQGLGDESWGLDNVAVMVSGSSGSPYVLGHAPSGTVDHPIDSVDVTFSEAINAATFTVDDVTMAGPAGPIAVNPPQDQGNHVWRISFSEQSADGEYCLSVGPHIEDLDGNEMDQDGDGTPGEVPDDVYVGCFVIDMTAPSVAGQTPSGEVNVPVDHIDLTFSEQVTADACTGGDIGLTGPNGNIVVSAPMDMGNNVWRISFASQSASGDYTLTVAPCFRDLAGNPMAGPYVGSFTIALPDLVGSDLAVPPSGNAGSQMDLSWRVTNAGAGGASGVWQDCIYLSNDDQPGSDVELGCFERPHELQPTEWYDQAVQVTIPAASQGDYWIILRADNGNSVFESDEGNNILIAGPITIVRPNLTASDVGIPLEGWTGQPVSISWTVANTSSAPTTGGWQDCIFLSSDDQVGGDTQLGCADRPHGLAGGESYEQLATVTIPEVPAGDYWIVVTADNGDALPESNESDNTAIAGPLPIYVTPTADLQVIDIAAPAEGLTGQAFELAWEVGNSGQAAAMGPWVDRVYISPDPQYDNGNDTLLGEMVFGGNLAVDASYTRVGQFHLPAQPGNYWIIVVTDATNTVYELEGESNNVTVDDNPVQVVQTPMPDLVVTQVIPPADGALSGSTTQVTFVVENCGSGATEVAFWRDSLFFSVDQQLVQPPEWLVDEPYVLGEYDNPQFLLAGDSYQQTANVTLPSDLAGTFYIAVYADSRTREGAQGATFDVPESNENNNLAFSAAFTVDLAPQPDLVVTDIAFSPNPVFSAQTLTITWTDLNQGSGPTDGGNWSDAIYLSTNTSPSIEPDDSLVGTNLRSGSVLPPDAFDDTRQYVWTIPPGTSGLYYVKVHSDVNNAISEFGFETNNVSVSSEQVEIVLSVSVDLLPTAVSGPASVIPGHDMQFTWSAENICAEPQLSMGWKDRVYLSADETFEPNTDALLGSFGHSTSPGEQGEPTLPPYTKTRSVRCPTDTTAGPHWLVVVVDANNNVFEGGCPDGESNNVLIGPTPIDVVLVPTDLTIEVNFDETHQLPTTAAAGQVLALSWRVSNTGAAVTPTSSWYDRAYVSADQTVSADDLIVATIAHDGELLPGSNYTVECTATAPLVGGGAYYLLCMVDAGNAVYEQPPGETNNTAVTPFTIVPDASDLVVTAITAPSTAQSGQPVHIEWTVLNQGTLETNASQWVDSVYLSRQVRVDRGAVLLGSRTRTGALAPGATYTLAGDFVLPIDYQGLYQIIVGTDSAHNVFETNEENNESAAPVLLDVALTDPANLVVTDVTVPTDATSGQSISVTWTVQNIGTGPTDVAGWNDAIYLSRDQFRDPGVDLYIGGWQRSGFLEPGGSYTATQNCAIPLGAAGPYFVVVATDVNEQVFENGLDEDNVASAPQLTDVTIPAPSDLVVGAITPPAAAMLGEMAEFIWHITNAGDQVVSGGWRDSVYLSADEQWDIGDRRVGTFARPPGALNPGESATVYGAAPIPAVLPGAYYVIVRTDVYNQIPETDEFNNVGVSAAPFTVSAIPLVLGTPYQGDLATGQDKYFALDTPAGETVRITLDHASPQAWTELYVRYGAVPTPGQFDFIFAAPSQPDQEITIPSTQVGTYFILARAVANAQPPATVFVLSANTLPFAIHSVTPARIGDLGRVTLRVRGARFAPQADVSLEQGGYTISAAEAFFVDGAEIKARFYLDGAPHGLFGVRVRNLDGSETLLPDAVTVETAAPLSAFVEGAGILTPRVGSVFQARGVLQNTGNIDAEYITLLARFTGDVQFGWSRPESTVPLQSAFEGADWANESPTAFYSDGTTWDGFIVRDLAPGEQITFALRAAGYAPGQFEVEFLVRARTTEQFIGKLADWFEKARQYLVDTGTEGLPAEVQAAAGDAEEWRAYWLHLYELLGIVGGTGSRLDGDQSLFLCHEPGYSDCLGECLDKYFHCLGEAAAFCAIEMEGCPAHIALCFVLHEVCKNVCEHVYCYRVDWVCVYGRWQWRYYDPYADDHDHYHTGAQGCGGGVVPGDPNEKIGVFGFGSEHYVGASAPLRYEIDFENVASATGPASEVRIRDALDPMLNLGSFRVGDIHFGQTTIDVPDGRMSYQTTVDLTATHGVLVEITAGVDAATSEAFWIFRSIDPATGEPPLSGLVGFLPPEDGTGAGQGWVEFTIQPRATATTGTIVRDRASIVFDQNQPMVTNEVFHTLDVDLPTSSVAPLPPVSPDPTIPLSWTGDDVGAGLASFTIYARLDAGPWSPVYSDTTDLTGVYEQARGGGVYDFYSVAKDNVGNTEGAPPTPDATTAVAVQIPTAPELNDVTAYTVHVVGLGSANADHIEHALWEATTGKYVGADGWLTEQVCWRPLNQWPCTVVRGLQPSTEYQFRAKARSHSGEETEFGPATTITTTAVLVGDMNCDGVIDMGDINPFVMYLSYFTMWQAMYPDCPPQIGDINGDGTYGQWSFGDINPFVALLTGGG